VINGACQYRPRVGLPVFIEVAGVVRASVVGVHDQADGGVGVAVERPVGHVDHLDRGPPGCASSRLSLNRLRLY
jgi:hypothetical protein